MIGNNLSDEVDFSILGKKEKAERFSKMFRLTEKVRGVTTHNSIISMLTL